MYLLESLFDKVADQRPANFIYEQLFLIEGSKSLMSTVILYKNFLINVKKDISGFSG